MANRYDENGNLVAYGDTEEGGSLMPESSGIDQTIYPSAPVIGSPYTIAGSSGIDYNNWTAGMGPNTPALSTKAVTSSPYDNITGSRTPTGGIRGATRTAANTGIPEVRSIGGGYATPPGSYLATQLPTYTPQTFNAPVYDESRVSQIAQERAAPTLRRLENKTNQALVSTQNLPGGARKITLRDVLAGYGEGRGSAVASARNAAVGEYNTEYGSQYKTAQENYQQQVAAEQARYNAELQRIWAIANATAKANG